MATRREDLGSWLEGTPGGSDDVSGLGLPLEGPGSLAPLSRRVPALLVDWLLAEAISWGFFDRHPLVTLAIFGLSTAILVATLGNTIGHRLLGLHVRRLRPAASAATTSILGSGVVPALVRTGLICLAIPPVIWDKDGRGMHDVAAGTVLVRR